MRPRCLIRTVVAGEGMRRETWWFQLADGSRTPVQTRMVDYDPRTRPWYVDAMRAKGAVLTEPYSFAQAKVVGVSAGMPLRQGGVIGFDFTLDTLSRLIGDYRFTPNSVIMVASDTGTVFMESEACRIDGGTCLPGEDEVRAAMRAAITRAVGSGERIERDVALGGRDYRLLVHQMPPALGRRYLVAAAVPIVELSVNSQTLLERAGLAAAVAVALAILGVLFASVVLSRSISRIAAKTERIRDLDFSDRTRVESRITEIVRLSDSVERMREGLEVFGRYVSKNLVHQIMRSPETAGVGGRRREITVMFTDIEGFSRITETLEPELLTSRLSRYFDALGSAILVNHGTIDKYIGDSIMAFWNAPEPDPDHIVNACRAALQAAAAGRLLSEKWRQLGRPGFRTRFGLHTGLAVVGNVGAREHINYTLVGAVANQASRMEGLNKMYHTEILATARSRALRPTTSYGVRSIASWPPARRRSTTSTSRWARSMPLASMPSSLPSGGSAAKPTAPAASRRRSLHFAPPPYSGPTMGRAASSSRAAWISCATARPRAGTAPGISTASDAASPDQWTVLREVGRIDGAAFSPAH